MLKHFKRKYEETVVQQRKVKKLKSLVKQMSRSTEPVERQRKIDAVCKNLYMEDMSQLKTDARFAYHTANNKITADDVSYCLLYIRESSMLTYCEIFNVGNVLTPERKRNHAIALKNADNTKEVQEKFLNDFGNCPICFEKLDIYCTNRDKDMRPTVFVENIHGKMEVDRMNVKQACSHTFCASCVYKLFQFSKYF